MGDFLIDGTTLIKYNGIATDVTIPNNIKTIGRSAFTYRNMTKVTVPNSVTKIEPWAFSHCKSLKTVCLSEGLLEIGESAFQDCGKLTNVKIPSTVKKIERWAFWECTALESITIPKSVLEMGDYVFYKCPRVRVTCEARVEPAKWSQNWNMSNHSAVWGVAPIERASTITTSINSGFVITNGKLERYSGKERDVVIPSTVKEIGNSAFRNNSTITSVTIPSSVTKICDWAFEDCTSLKRVNLQNGLLEIGISAFQNCRALTDIKIPSTVKKIAKWAFWDCVSLKSITIPKSVLEMGDYVFYGCNGIRISCEAPSKPFGWLSAFNESPSIVTWGVASSKDTETKESKDFIIENGVLKKYVGCEKSIVVPEGVVEIAPYVFLGNKNLTGVKLPQSLVKIGNGAFFDCVNLESIELPSNLRVIDEKSFWGCARLKALELPSTLEKIGKYAFWECEGLEKITIPEKTVVDGYAFFGCESLTIYPQVYSMPTTWASNWNPTNCPVAWGNGTKIIRTTK